MGALQRLTGLERQKIEDEYEAVIKKIERLRSTLESRPKRLEIIKSELQEAKEQYGDERRTEKVISAAEWVIDLGPGGGRHGGEIVAAGRPADLVTEGASLTGKWLARAARDVENT